MKKNLLILTVFFILGACVFPLEQERTNPHDPLYEAPVAPGGAVEINGGEAVTVFPRVMVVVSASNNVAQMQISDSESLADASWVNLTNTNFFTFTGYGTNTIYVKFKDNTGQESPIYSDSIYTTPILQPNGSILDSQPTFYWSEKFVSGGDFMFIVGTSSNLSSPFLETNINVTNITGLFSLSNNVTNYWKVAIVMGSGNTWSETPAQMVFLDFPILNAINTNPWFFTNQPTLEWEWSAEGDFMSNTTYDVQVSSNGDFNQLVDIAEGLTNLQYTLTNTLFHGVRYEWRVRFIDNNGIPSDWDDSGSVWVDVEGPSISTVLMFNIMIDNNILVNPNITNFGFTAYENPSRMSVYGGSNCISNAYLSLNGGQFKSLSETEYTDRSGFGTNISLSEGIYNFRIYAVDDVGNHSPTNEYTNISISSTIYVSPSGNDSNSGSLAAPLLTIQEAVNNSVDGFESIYLESGTYTPGAGLNNNPTSGDRYSGVNIEDFQLNNITIKGGWNSNFTSQTGYSILQGDGAGNPNSILSCVSVKNISIDGLIITGGYATTTVNEYVSGAGIHIWESTNITISNCIISNNTANNYGGGLYLVSSGNNQIYAIISNNSAMNNGGGIALFKADNNYFDVEVIANNSINSGGGGIYFYKEADGNTIKGIVSHNNGANNGGGISLENSINNNIYPTIFGNTASGKGGGICVYGTENTTITNYITNNTASTGGGLFYNGVNVNFDYSSAIITNNTPNNIVAE